MQMKNKFNKKSPRKTEGIIYMDGLVSTGNKFPITILEIILFNQKIFANYFINILKFPVDKTTGFLLFPGKIFQSKK